MSFNPYLPSKTVQEPLNDQQNVLPFPAQPQLLYFQWPSYSSCNINYTGEYPFFNPYYSTANTTIRTHSKSTANKGLQSAKKNSESNIVNQFYAYFASKAKADRIIVRVLTAMDRPSHLHKEIVTRFNTLFCVVNSTRNRKYVNHKTLTKCFTSEGLVDLLEENKYTNIQFTMEQLDEFCQVFRRACHYFFKNESRLSVLTSKRISAESTLQHYYKIRKVTKDIVDTNN